MGLAQWPWPNHRSMPTLHFLTTLAPFFHVSGFLGLPPVSQGCLSIGGRGILIGKRQPASSKSPSFIASTRNLSLYWGNYTNRLCDLSGSFQCNQFFSIPLISPKSPKDQVIHLWPHSINHQILLCIPLIRAKAKQKWIMWKKGDLIYTGKDERWLIDDKKNGPTGRLDRSKHFLYPALPLDVTKAVKMALFMGIKTPSRAVVFSHYKKPSNHFRLASSWDRGAQWHCQIRSLVNQPIIPQTREAAEDCLVECCL